MYQRIITHVDNHCSACLAAFPLSLPLSSRFSSVTSTLETLLKPKEFENGGLSVSVWTEGI